MKRFLLIGVVVAVSGALMAGCPAQDSRTSNQGGGSIASAGIKFASGNISGLTADEIQIVADFVSGVSAQFSELEIDDDQAAAAVEFLEANDINTVADVQALAENPDDSEIPDSVQAIIEATSLDQFKN